MKNLYLKGILLLAYLNFFIQINIQAQCLCTGGIPAKAIKQSITIAPTTASALTYSFQQFDPTIGTLSCVTLRDTISGVSVSGAINTGSRTASGPPVASDSTIFDFLLALTNTVSGPGISISNTFTKTYGPDTLSYYGTTGDTVTHGPDNVINNPINIKKIGGNAAYVGNGTVNFIYTINGGMIDTRGGPNYRTKVTTVFGGTLNLTYYWCPTIALGNAISNFSIFKKNGSVSLQWLGDNDQKDITYEVEYSRDGEQWQPVGTIPAGSAPIGTVAQYQYQFNPSQIDVGQIYFRIKRSDSEGNFLYSVVKGINLQQADRRPGMQIYPNPVNQKILIQFDEQQNGNFSFELVNTTGQVIEKRQVQLTGTSISNMELSTKPASGIYFLRAVDPAHNRQFLTKVIVN